MGRGKTRDDTCKSRTNLVFWVTIESQSRCSIVTFRSHEHTRPRPDHTHYSSSVHTLWHVHVVKWVDVHTHFSMFAAHTQTLLKTHVCCPYTNTSQDTCLPPIHKHFLRHMFAAHTQHTKQNTCTHAHTQSHAVAYTCVHRDTQTHK